MAFDDVTWFEPGRSSTLRGPMLRVSPQYVTISRELAEDMLEESWHVGVRRQDGRIVLFAQPTEKGANVMVSRSSRRLGGRTLAAFLREQGVPQTWAEAQVNRSGQKVNTVRVEWPL